jgi:hypothetical protein
MNNYLEPGYGQKKTDCVFFGPVFGGEWIPISEVEVVGTTKDPGLIGLTRVSFPYKGKKYQSAIVMK